ncbi:hypothetical protein RYZ26_18530 [Terasakiella sp. A23]|uniref:hypothetical protein n=1 Tax=Terasakiella sp. FCG-A23 TaxID=3080561 RepID=UPI002955ABCB|nr:hypothetical protein [Terasakiella sp. A23]MDV7341607.1 hypothetical protein [Terasakiella sp. A23]
MDHIIIFAAASAGISAICWFFQDWLKYDKKFFEGSALFGSSGIALILGLAQCNIYFYGLSFFLLVLCFKSLTKCSTALIRRILIAGTGVFAIIWVLMLQDENSVKILGDIKKLFGIEN